MVYLKALAVLAITLFLYIIISMTGATKYSGVAPVVAAFGLTTETVNAALLALWDYLCAHSFCPWLMVFRGRSSSDLLVEAGNHAIRFVSAESSSELWDSFLGILLSLGEIVGGPVVAAIIGLAQAFLMFKSITLVFGKLIRVR